jgi:hypothetical protein
VSSLDDILGDLSRGVGALSTRATSTLFAASAAALAPAFRDWATLGEQAHDQAASVPLLEQAIEIGFELSLTGASETDLPATLRRLEWITPSRTQAPGSTAAQDCLICADVAIRVHVEPAFACGPVVEYALEPVLLAATQRVSAAADPENGLGRPLAADALLEDARVMGAVGFMWFAIMRLRPKPEPDAHTIEEIRSRATVLLP